VVPLGSVRCTPGYRGTPVGNHCFRRLLTRRTVFSKTVFGTARSTFRMYSVMANINSSIVCTVIVRCTATFFWPCRTCGSKYLIVLQLCKSKGKGVPRQAEVVQGVPGRLRPRIFLTFRHYKGSRSSAKRTGRIYPRRNPWFSLSEAESTSGHMVLSGVTRKNFSVTPPGNRSRDHPTSSAAP